MIHKIIKESLQDLNNNMSFTCSGNGSKKEFRDVMEEKFIDTDDMPAIEDEDDSDIDDEGYIKEIPNGSIGKLRRIHENGTRKIINWYDEVEKTYHMVAMIKSEMNPISQDFRATNIMDAINQANAYFSKFSRYGEKDVDIYYIKHDNYNGI